MKKSNFLPSDEAGKELWLKNFAAKLSKYAAKYGIVNTEVTDMVQSSAYITYINDYHQQYKEYLKEVTEYKKEVYGGNKMNNTPSQVPQPPVFSNVPAIVLPAVFDRAISIGNRILDHTKYTTADGTDIGIEVTPKAKRVIDTKIAKPDIKLQLIDGGHPELVWKRNGLDALEIWVDRGDDRGFMFCEIDLKPNFTDEYNLPTKPELWRYKAIYRMDNKQVGKWSDIVSIAVVKL